MLTQTTVSKKCHCQSPLEKASLRCKTRNCEVVVLSWSAGRKSAVSLSAGIARWYSVHCTAPRGTGISSVSCGSLWVFFNIEVQMAKKGALSLKILTTFKVLGITIFRTREYKREERQSSASSQEK